jgi:hypothetical protein
MQGNSRYRTLLQRHKGTFEALSCTSKDFLKFFTALFVEPVEALHGTVLANCSLNYMPRLGIGIPASASRVIASRNLVGSRNSSRGR